MSVKVELYQDIDQLLSRAGYPKDNGIVGKAIALYERKNIPLNHILAEVLIAHYMKRRGFEFVDIEHTVANTKCDVYAQSKRIDICIEIEFHFIPPRYVVSGYEYHIAKHVKKVAQATRSGIKYVAFAYPKGLVPLLPLDLLRPPIVRARRKLGELSALARKYFALSAEEEEALMHANIYCVLIFDFGSGKVYELTPQAVETLITLYESFLC